MDPISAQNHSDQDARAARWIGWILRFGVVTSAGLILFGLILVAFASDGVSIPDTDMALGRGTTNVPVDIDQILHGVGHFRGIQVIELGILVLIATPTARVAVTFALICAERRRALAGMAGLVLIILILGLIGIGLE